MTPNKLHGNIRAVVLAKARTHYPKSQLLRDARAAIPLITEGGGYGSWLSPGRRTMSPACNFRCDVSPPYSAISAGGRAAGPASGRSSIVIMQIEAVVSSTAAAPNT